MAAEDTLPVIRVSIVMFKSVDEVWEKLLDPVIMLQWLGNEISADLKVGGAIEFFGENAPTTPEISNRWVIRRIRSKQALLCSWDILGVETLFLIRLSAVGPGTLVEVRHGALPVSAKPFHLPEHWRLLLANFRSVVELGEHAIRFNYEEYRPLRVTRYDLPEVRLSVLCRVPASLPFDVWTNPEKLRHFVRADAPVVDRRYGGLYTWWAEGMGPVVFTRVVQDRELEFSWVYENEIETRVNIRFEPVEANTLVTLHHYGFRTAEAAVGYNIGWASILAELKLVCELGESGTNVEYGGTV